MEDDKIKIKIKYNDEIKSIDFPYTLEDLTIDFKKIFNIKGNKYFNFSYSKKYLTLKAINILIFHILLIGSFTTEISKKKLEF